MALLANLSEYEKRKFVATTTFHPQLIPARLLLTIATAREWVPFPAVE